MNKIISLSIDIINELDQDKQKKILEVSNQNLNISLNFGELMSRNPQIDDIKDEIIKLSNKNINLKKTKYSEEIFSYAQKSILLQIIDKSWKEHLLSLDHLRQGISLRAYGQKDPLNEYKQEAFIMFEEMMESIRFNITKIISFIEIKTEAPRPESENINDQGGEGKENHKKKKIPRNAICPLCDSGKKYKRCCGKI